MRSISLAIFVMINGSCMRPHAPALPESPWQQSAYALPKIPRQDILLQQWMEVQGEDVECTFFEQHGEFCIRIGQREFRILGTTNADGKPVEFSPQLVQIARQSLTLKSHEGIVTLTANIPIVMTGKFNVQEDDLSAALATLSDKNRSEMSIPLTVSSGAFSMPMYGEKTYSETLCVLRAEEEGAEMLFVGK